MTITGVLWRFALAYILSLVAVGAVLDFLGFAGNSGLNIAVLAGCIMWSCILFGKANNRYFTRSEKTTVLLGMLAIDIVLQVATLYATSFQAVSDAGIKAMVIALGVLGLFHALTIYLFIGFAGKLLARLNENAGDGNDNDKPQ